KVTLTLGPGPLGIEAGFYRVHSRELVPIEACPVQDDAATRYALALVAALRAAGATAWDGERGDARHVLVRKGAKTGELYGVLVARTDDLPWLDRFVERARGLGGVGLALNVSPPRERDLVLGPETRV